MNFWCHYKCLSTLPKIGYPQFIDCNRKIVLLTKHPAFKEKYRCSDNNLKKFKATELHNQCRGMHIECSPNNVNTNTPSYNIIFIDHLINGDKKLLSVIIHEVSHLVDFILKNAYVKEVDTEIRAYLMDYYTEQIFYMMEFSFPTSSLDIRKKKWGKKLAKLKRKLVKKLNLRHSGELYTKATAKQIRESGIKNVDMFFETGPRK